VIHHIPTRAERVLVLREIGRVLKPGARLLVSVWDREQPRFRDASSPDLEVAWPLPDGTRVPRFYHVFADGELESLVIDAGLHGERFFRSRGNRFGEVRNNG
jgi:tRNA (uracil-5-)-methyltransferase TRM9